MITLQLKDVSHVCAMNEFLRLQTKIGENFLSSGMNSSSEFIYDLDHGEFFHCVTSAEVCAAINLCI